MPDARGLFRSLPVALSLLLFFAPIAGAEFYLSGYLGASITQDNDLKLRDNTIFLLTGTPVFDFTLQNVSFDTSFMGGGKVGYWLGPLPNLGIEVDAYHYSPDIGRQTVNLTGTVIGIPIPPTPTTLGSTNPVAGNVSRATIGVTAVGFHLVGRLRLSQSGDFPNGRFQPYLGVGPGIFFSDARLKPFTNQSDSDTSVGVQALGGLKFFFNKNVSIFGEYKFSHFSPEFKVDSFGIGTKSTRVSTDVTSHHLYGGVAFHFDLL